MGTLIKVQPVMCFQSWGLQTKLGLSGAKIKNCFYGLAFYR